jgi:hypothetical protein
MPEREPDMVSLRELARRLVADGVLPAISHQRVSQLSRSDPAFPPVITIGRSRSVDYAHARRYFERRESRQGQRTDLAED